ncbi:hypothetical protein [Halosimplex salinum]|uniref:hypothetical protein n=1 Tax=Halosimplex salinum TaxID=1710538 RepID=UPI000F462238|nr:hypothetical protein [Halosimplex salinum]
MIEELQRPTAPADASSSADSSAETASEYAARRLVAPGRDETVFGGTAFTAEAAVSSLDFQTVDLPRETLGLARVEPADSMPGGGVETTGARTTDAPAGEPGRNRARTRAASPPPPRPSGRINFGHAHVEALDPRQFAFASDPRFDYYILGVPFTIERPPSFREFRSVEVLFDLATPDATAHGLAPDQSSTVDATGQRTVSNKYWLAPDLSLSTGAVSLGGAEKVVTFTTPVTAVRAMNHYRPDPYWVYERPGGVEYGSRWAVMVVSTPVGAETLSGTASALAEFRPFGGDFSGPLPFDLPLPEEGVRIDPFLSRHPPAS